MAAVVIGDINTLSSAINNTYLCGVKDAVESLFFIYIV